MRNGNHPGAMQAGFTYIALLIIVAMIAAGATAALGAGAALQQRESEAELLAIGLEFRQALQSYAEATPSGQPTEPRELSRTSARPALSRRAPPPAAHLPRSTDRPD